MFPYFYVVVAAGGLVLGAVEAKALTNTAPAGLRAGVETVDLVEPVHCRQYRHGHRHGHGWSRGCRIGVIVAPSRRSVVIRERGGVRTGTSIRSRTIVRTPSGAAPQTTTRSGDRPRG
jgi:hypothetical protein